MTSENKYQQLTVNALKTREGRKPKIGYFSKCVKISPSEHLFVFLVCSWWGPVPTCSDWCPSWSSSLFRLWSFFSQSSSSSFQKCCPPPLRQSRKRHVLTHTCTAVWMTLSQAYLWLCNLTDMMVSSVPCDQGLWKYNITTPNIHYT